MNDILQLKGRMQERDSKGRGGAAMLPKGKDKVTHSEPRVSSKSMRAQAEQLLELEKRWRENTVIDGALVDVCYRDVIAKSNRVRALFRAYPKEANDTVVGARFGDNDHHIITHHVTTTMLRDGAGLLSKAANVIDTEYGGVICASELESINKKQIDFALYGIPVSTFRQLVVDSYYVTKFDYPEPIERPTESIITLYRVSNDMRSFLKSIGIDIQEDERFFGDANTTVQLRPKEIDLLFNKAPYLIAMAVEDMNDLVKDDEGQIVREPWQTTIPDPKNEPVVGVIDTPINLEGIYFEKWVTYEPMFAPGVEETLTTEDERHGTAVTSIIVDGPSINPELDDRCGRFQVKHFGVARKGKMSSFDIMRKIESIIESNPTIRVWNLSLGSEREVAKSYISPEAAMLDELQNKHDVVFVVSGTNDFTGSIPGRKKIGSPADSINAIVVNAVDEHSEPASYTRSGQVLSFFRKPDISYFGGDKAQPMVVCTPLGREYMVGTSLAAPWITRKMAFMIEVLGLSREVAKALLIDSAADWDDIGNDPKRVTLLGHGVVPKNIRDVVQSKDNEIKFVIDRLSNAYDTYTYSLPVPTDSNRHPFIAKATLCYFPECSISQGVDYTKTELDVYIGRIETIPEKQPRLKPIDKNVQSLDDGESHWVDEKTARDVFRKWDNTKHIREVMKDKLVPRKAYKEGLWGISVKRKNRIKGTDGDNLHFGLVVTLREINNVNRINDFIQQCALRGWLVNKIDIDASLDIYAKSQETLEL